MLDGSRRLFQSGSDGLPYAAALLGANAMASPLDLASAQSRVMASGNLC